MSRKKLLPIILVLIVQIIVSLACSSSDNSTSQAPTAAEAKPTKISLEPSNTPKPVDTIRPTSTSKPTDTPEPTSTIDPNVISAGTFLVGVDIQPGLYRGYAGDNMFDSCYWQRLKDLSGEFDAILANDNAVGQFYVEVKETDYAFEVNCVMTRLTEIKQQTEFPTEVQAGTYLVGVDIKPGTYRGKAGSEITESCYWMRLSGLSGGFENIIANDNATGQYYVQVSASDKALHTACPLTWVSE